jgi:hypothetical protein
LTDNFGTSEAYASGATATVTETPGAGYSFIGWTCTGDAVSACTSAGTTSTVSFIVTTGATVTADFALTPPPTYTVTTAISDGTVGGTSGSTALTDNLGTSEAYASGATATVTETPGAGYSFTGWTCTGDAVSACTSAGTTSTVSFIVTTGATVTADFAPI